MRPAPPLSLTCSGHGAWCQARTVLAALATATLVAWGSSHLGFTALGVACAAATAALGAAFGARRAIQPRSELLVWDGALWQLDGAAGELDLMLDAGALLLLRHRPAAAPARWWAVSAREAGPAFHALRAAVHAPAPTARRHARAVHRLSA